MELTTYFNTNLARKTTLRGYVLAGFADGSPDWGVGIGVSFEQ